MKKAKILANLKCLYARLGREDISTPEEDRALGKVIRKMAKTRKKANELEACKEEIKRLRPLTFRPALELELERLKTIHAPEHPEHTRGDWIEEVAASNTLIGYWEWLLHKLEEA